MIQELSFATESFPHPVMADSSQWESFKTEVLSWLGTPFRHFTAVKHRGVDCSLLVGSIYKNLGYITFLDYEYYPVDWFVHSTNELILQYMHEHMLRYTAPGYAIKEVTDGFYRGDVLALNMTRNGLSNHCVIYMGGNSIIHAMVTSGVEKTEFTTFAQAHVKSVFRIYRTE